MKLTSVAGLLLGAAVLIAMPAQADTCSAGCNIQTKKPSATKKGEFDYTLSCILDSSGQELITKVTATNDAQAKAKAAKQC